MLKIRLFTSPNRHEGIKKTDNLGDKSKSDLLASLVRLQLETGCRRVRSFFYSVIERLGAAIFLLASLPLFILVPAIIKLKDGGPVFYAGRRMGKDKQIFNMYKFRSLSPETEQRIGAQLLHHSHAAEIPFGRFLRDTRIDEIPQLLNIIMGHMQFWGPRPERPSLYTEHCSQIRGYDRRFEVKPGLFGHSQILTPHSTPKRIRTLIDNRCINRSKNISFMVFSTPLVIFFLLLRMARKCLAKAKTQFLIKSRKGLSAERRALERIGDSGHQLEIDSDDTDIGPNKLRLVNINDDCLSLYANEQLSDSPIRLRLKIEKNAWLSQRIKFKTARVIGKILRHQKIDGDSYNNAYVISYSACSPLNRYTIDKYLLKKSIL